MWNPYKRSIRHSLFAALVLLLTQAPASAQIVAVSNLGYGGDGFFRAAGYSVSFTTAGAGFNLNSVDLFAHILGGADGGTASYSALLRNDAAGIPGHTLLATSATSSTISVGANGLYSGFLGMDFGSFALSANTTYWLTFQTPGSGTVYSALNYTDVTNESSSVGWTIGNRSDGGESAFDIPMFRVNATAAAIPEPGTYAALCGLAALGVAVYRRRRKRA
jgi:hypothetical protein